MIVNSFKERTCLKLSMKLVYENPSDTEISGGNADFLLRSKKKINNFFLLNRLHSMTILLVPVYSNNFAFYFFIFVSVYCS